MQLFIIFKTIQISKKVFGIIMQRVQYINFDNSNDIGGVVKNPARLIQLDTVSLFCEYFLLFLLLLLLLVLTYYCQFMIVGPDIGVHFKLTVNYYNLLYYIYYFVKFVFIFYYLFSQKIVYFQRLGHLGQQCCEFIYPVNLTSF